MNAVTEMLTEIKGSKGHKMFLLAMTGLFIAVAIWKFSPGPTNTRQATIDRAVAEATSTNK